MAQSNKSRTRAEATKKRREAGRNGRKRRSAHLSNHPGRCLAGGATAEEFIIGELERNRFNTERAVEVYRFAIDNSAWALVKNMPVGRLMFRGYLLSGLGKKLATELTEKFKKGSGRFAPVEDQRPPRRFLCSLLGA